MAISTLERINAPGRRRSAANAPGWAIASALGAIGFVASVVGSGIPSLWGDEAASVLSAERPLPSLFPMLGRVDAVHGTYYLFLHFWVGAFGTSPTAVRFPSAIAAGLIVAGVFVLATTLATRRLGILSSLICAFLPRTLIMGGEARSYAMSTALAVWLTILLVTLVRRRDTRRLVWLGYGLGLAIGLYLFLYLALLVPVHTVYVLFRSRHPLTRRRWVQGTLFAAILAVPIIWYGYQERQQIAFLKHRHYVTLPNILVDEWFGGPSGWFAVVAWGLILVALIAVIRLAWRRRWVSSLALLALAWLVLPTVLLLAMNAVSPTYSIRYLSQSDPAAAILIGMGILALRRRWLVVAAMVLVFAVALPFDVAARAPTAYNGSDWAEVSQYVHTVARPGEAVVFDNSTRPSLRPRLALRMYPDDWARLVDVELTTAYYDTSWLWDRTAALETVAPRLDTISSALVVDLKNSTDYHAHADLYTLENLGFTLRHTHVIDNTVIYQLTRDQE